MKTFDELVRFNGKVTFQTQPYPATATLFPNDTTPSVNGLELVKGSGSTVTVTQFDGGVDGQMIRVIGDGTTTVKNNSTIATNTGADKLLAVGLVYTFSYVDEDNKWYENA